MRPMTNHPAELHFGIGYKGPLPEGWTLVEREDYFAYGVDPGGNEYYLGRWAYYPKNGSNIDTKNGVINFAPSPVTPPSDTPETDAKLLDSWCSFNCGHVFYLSSDPDQTEEVASGNYEVVVLADFARKLERERNSWRRVARLLHESLFSEEPWKERQAVREFEAMKEFEK